MAATLQSRFPEKDSVRIQESTPNVDSNHLLEQVARTAQQVTGASGAALVLSDGKIMSCRACSGNLVPPVGTGLNIKTGFTATCVQTAEVVRCDDTKVDPRVDGSRCIDSGLRSILAVPIFDAPDVAGVLEVLSNRPHNFTDKHAIELQLLARVIEAFLNYVPHNNVSVHSTIHEAQSRGGDVRKTNGDQATLTCVSCRHSNPHASQFCNRCGSILFSFLGPEDAGVSSNSLKTDPSSEEGFKNIRKLISGSGLPGTWSEISQRLLADQQSILAQNRPQTAASEERAKRTEDPAKTAGTVSREKIQEANRPKTPQESPLRRRLWH